MSTGPAAERPAGPVRPGATPDAAPLSGDTAASDPSPEGRPPASVVGDQPLPPTVPDDGKAESPGEDQSPLQNHQGPLASAAAGADGLAPDAVAEVVDADLTRLVEDVERLQGEREELLDQLLRTRADFDNYRKRMLRQQAEQAERAAEDLVGKLLEVLDVFEAAQTHGQGFDQVCSRLVVVLEKEGLARIDPTGTTFDPTEADAVAHEPAEDSEAAGPTVSAVLRSGYRWKGRVLRPAMVKVRG